MEKSEKLFERALKVTPGGIHSGYRGLPHWAPYPVFMERGKGSKIYDVDGKEYIDYLLAYGPLILGHAHPKIIQAVKKQLERGSTFGAPHETEIKVAEKVVKAVPCAEKVKFSNSGTEAVLNAVRLARAYTGKNRIIKFEGNYHGWWDTLYVSVHPPVSVAGLEISPYKVPASPGIPEATLKDIVILPWNNADMLRKTVKEQGHEVAAVITEPCLANSGCIPPEEGYLESMREITEENDIVLIFDEVITGFRLSLGGAQEYYGVTPDLATFGKSIGGGFPVSAVSGKENIMNLAAPGKVAYAGTFNSNPISMAAALATLEELEAEGVYRHLFRIGKRLVDGLRDIVERLGLKAVIQGPGPFWQIYFTQLEKVRSYRDACAVDTSMFRRFWRGSIKRGVLFHPSYLETWFVSAVHTDDDIERTLVNLEIALKAAK